MDMGHPLFDNIRKDDWLIDYIDARLGGIAALARFKSFFLDASKKIKLVPISFKPKYFSKLIIALWD